MIPIRSFFKEATSELLYNIVSDHKDDEGEISYKGLSDEFEGKVGYQPMKFFGLGNITNEGWFEFLNQSHGLSLYGRYISINDSDEAVYEDYNTSFLFNQQQSVAEYREMLLIRACKLIAEDGFPNVNNQDQASGNTPLHLVAALPGVAHDEPTLFQYLLEAGADPLQENKEGLNVLHIIAGRMKAEEGQEDKVYFGNERVEESSWEIGHRQALLKILSKKVSPAHLSMLMSRSGRDGSTVMHESVLSASDVNLFGAPTARQTRNEIKIVSTMLSFGGNVNIPNKFGLVPLHFAYDSVVFMLLIQKGAVCRSRNWQDETPFLFILKCLISLAFRVNISGTEKINKSADKRIKETNLQGFVEKAVLILKHLINSVDESEELRKTVWIPDMEDNSPLRFVLISVRMASYIVFKLKEISNQYENLRKYLVQLLQRILRSGTPDHLRRKNKKGQSPLHILLDLGSNNPNNVIVDTEVIQCLQALLENGADVNAVDSRAQTALDVVHKYSVTMPSLYTKCTEILRKYGAQDHSEVAANISATQQRLSNLTLFPGSNVKRKLRGACPQRHLNTAEQLTDGRSPGVTVVEKYRYFSQRSIGSGGFSSIYVATKDEHEDRKSRTIDCRAVALKRLEKAKVDPQEIKREVQALLSFSTGCENILNCYNSFDDDFFHYLCLDLMDGDLQQFIDEKIVREFVSQLATTLQAAVKDISNGLKYLHENNCIHRDLKPGNVLYTIHPSLHFKIGDFGLAKSISSSSTMTSSRGGGVAMAPGTRCWMAPELVSLRSREHTKESDVFALGLVLHFLLSLGKHPFVGATEEPPHVIEKNLVDMKMSIDTSLSSEASHFIQTILAKNPSKRLPAAFLQQHPFLWSVKKKIEFLKAVGDQPEAVNPSNYPNSVLEQCLQKTNMGRRIARSPWAIQGQLQELYIEMTRTWKHKKYRTDNVIDLLRFLRNSYSHKEERSLNFKQELDNNIFLKIFPSLVLEVYGAVQNAGMVDDPNRSNIRQALLMS